MLILDKIFFKQMMMRRVLYSLLPIILVATYFFGLRTLVLMLLVTFAATITEFIFQRRLNKPVSEAVIVTSVLFTLTLPVSTPFWVAIVGIVFGIVFAKEVFGGFGRNIFNPALVSRTFLYVCFPKFLTVQWNMPSISLPGGLTTYITPSVDAVSQSTPLLILAQTGKMTPLNNLFWGNTSGSLGETSAFILLLAGIYLLYSKTADWRLMLSPILGFISLNSILYLFNVPSAPSPIWGLFSGSIIFISVFFSTEPITAPRTIQGKWIYGILIGCNTILIRVYGIFVEGGMFAVLIMNTFAPIIDETVKYAIVQQKRKVVA